MCFYASEFSDSNFALFSDIEWENMRHSRRLQWKAVVVYPILFVLLILCTSPEYLTFQFDKLLENIAQNENVRLPMIVKEYLPAVFLILVSRLCPFLLEYSVIFMGHWSQSQINYKILQQSTIYLILVVLLLPTASVLTLRAFLDFSWHLGSHTIVHTLRQHWECIFFPEGGAFYSK